MQLCNMNHIVGTHDLLLLVLDTLRHDVACQALEEGRTPNLEALLPESGWERRHSPGSFTYSAHHAFFAGFLPTPPGPGPHPRLFAPRFEGSESTAPETWVFEQADLPGGLRAHGYHTLCIGGVGFFNKRNALGGVLPGLFCESHWDPSLGVTDPDSTENQVRRAVECLARLAPSKRALVFINVSALHQPNCIFSPGTTTDSPETMANALAYVDQQIGPLLDAMLQRAPLFYVITSDHGTAYGEDGLVGHRLAHPVVWEVPYAEGILEQPL